MPGRPRRGPWPARGGNREHSTRLATSCLTVAATIFPSRMRAPHQWRKCLLPVNTRAMPCSSAAATSSSSLRDPPGSTTAVTPAAASTSRPSRNGKKASDAATAPRARSPALRTARSAAPTRD